MLLRENSFHKNMAVGMCASPRLSCRPCKQGVRLLKHPTGNKPHTEICSSNLFHTLIQMKERIWTNRNLSSPVPCRNTISGWRAHLKTGWCSPTRADTWDLETVHHFTACFFMLLLWGFCKSSLEVFMTRKEPVTVHNSTI